MPEMIIGLGAARYFIQSEDDYSSRNYEGPSLDWMDIKLELFLGSKYDSENSDIPSSRKYFANIVGIIKDENEDYHNNDIYISLETARKIVQENYKLAAKSNIDINTYDNVYVYAENMEDVSEILKVIKGYGFEAYSQTEWIEEMKEQQQSQQGQLAAIGFISLLVSAIGIANTMMTSILERRREIGVMKVIGVAIRKIRLIFLVESALIGLMGGLLGVTLGHLLAYLMNTGANTNAILGMQFASGVKINIPLWLDLAAVGMAIAVGMIAGIFPARRATKMSAIEAIRAV
jgi:ABC-type antimicrobial peptide transport system permease subunit